MIEVNFFGMFFNVILDNVNPLFNFKLSDYDNFILDYFWPHCRGNS